MIYSALFLSVMEKNMGEQRRVSFAVNGRCDIMLRCQFLYCSDL